MSAYAAIRDWVDRTLAGTGDKAALLPGVLPMLIALLPGMRHDAWLFAFAWFVAWSAFVAWRFWFFAKDLVATSRKLKKKQHG